MKEKLLNPKFWLALIGVIIPVLNSQLGLHIDSAQILGICGVLATSIGGFAHWEATQLKFPPAPQPDSNGHVKLISELKFELQKTKSVLDSLGIKYENGTVSLPVSALGQAIQASQPVQAVQPSQPVQAASTTVIPASPVDSQPSTQVSSN